MGRTRKILSEQTGNLTKENQTRRIIEQDMTKTGTDYFLKPPKWLINSVSVREYKRIAGELSKLELLGNLDTNALGNYCNAFAMYTEITKKLKDAPLTVTNSAGNEVENPLVNLQIKYSKEMRENGRLCGITIDSRLKFASQKLDVINDNISEEFGDI
ncbi:MAG: phage terminase small subunit P27 family [Ruminococcus sp.]|nr:phage terminase small subunit P27 family [Ruminococcus sp.]